MSTEHPHLDPPAASDRVAAAYTALIADLATRLDLAAGATDATRPAAYHALSGDLSTVLDLDAGLAAIVDSDSSPPTPARTVGDRSAHGIADRLASMTDVERLNLRTHPSFRALRGAVALANDLARNRAHALALATELDRTHGSNVVIALGPALDVTRNFVLLLDRARDLDLDLARARRRGRNLMIALSTLTALRESAARARARHQARARWRARAFARALDLDYHRVHARARFFARDLDLDLDLFAEGGASSGLVAALAQIGDDFVDADLRAARGQPTSPHLDGIRWSTTTCWPPGWDAPIRAASVPIGPRIFQVIGDSREHHLSPTRT